MNVGFNIDDPITWQESSFGITGNYTFKFQFERLLFEEIYVLKHPYDNIFLPIDLTKIINIVIFNFFEKIKPVGLIINCEIKRSKDYSEIATFHDILTRLSSKYSFSFHRIDHGTAMTLVVMNTKFSKQDVEQIILKYKQSENS